MSQEQVNLNKLLQLAVARGNEGPVSFLLRHGADPNARVDAREDPLQRYGGPRRREMRDILDSLGADCQGRRRRANSVTSATLARRIDELEDEKLQEKRERSFSFFGGKQSAKLGGKRANAGASKYGTWDINKYRKMAKEYMRRETEIVEWRGEEVSQASEPTTSSTSTAEPAGSKSETARNEPASNRRRSFGFLDSWIGRKRQPSVRAAVLSRPTAMHQAAASGNSRIIAELARHGADVNAELDGTYGPLDIAALYGHREAASLLVDLGARVNARLETGRTALYHAVKARQPGVVELLLERGASARSRTPLGFTPLHLAVVRDCPEAVELLLRQGSCDPNARTSTGLTPLHCAATRARPEILEALLANGADPRALLRKDGSVDVAPLSFEREDEQARVAAVLGKYAPKPGLCRKIIKKVWDRFVAADNQVSIAR